MLPDQVSNPGPLTYESSALPIALRGPAQVHLHCILVQETQKMWLLKTGDPLIQVAT